MPRHRRLGLGGAWTVRSELPLPTALHDDAEVLDPAEPEFHLCVRLPADVKRLVQECQPSAVVSVPASNAATSSSKPATYSRSRRSSTSPGGESRYKAQARRARLEDRSPRLVCRSRRPDVTSNACRLPKAFLSAPRRGSTITTSPSSSWRARARLCAGALDGEADSIRRCAGVRACCAWVGGRRTADRLGPAIRYRRRATLT